jgi:hypothetical protein
MKYLLSVLIVLFLTVSAYALDWHTANQSTIEWDAPTALSNGEPIPSDNTLNYVVYLADDDINKSNAVEIGETTETTYTLTLNTEGKFYAGVKAQRMDGEGTILNESVIAWSDEELYVVDNMTFGLQYFFATNPISGLRPQEGNL